MKVPERELQQEIYGRQRRVLEAEHARAGVDIFLSPFDILRSQDGTALSYCTWPEGVASSLPRADCIAFTGMRDKQRWYTIVPWDTVLAVCGSLLRRVPDLEPVRFEVVGWPDPQQLRRLQDAAVVRKG